MFVAEGKIEEFSQEGFDCNFIGMVVHAGIEVGTLYIPDAEEVVVLFVVPFNAKLVEIQCSLWMLFWSWGL